MKYYIYISDTKLDMLTQQVPPRLKNKLAGELRIDLKFLGATVKREHAEETKYKKLDFVVNYIEKHMEVGTIDEPKEYFRGNIPVRWGPYDRGDKIVYFGGFTSQTVLGLGGSLHHVIGVEGRSGIHSHSVTPYLLAVLCNELQLTAPWDRAIERLTIQEMYPDALSAVEIATRNLTGPEQRVEFLAKRLVQKSNVVSDDRSPWLPKYMNILLGTPIYVALFE